MAEKEKVEKKDDEQKQKAKPVRKQNTSAVVQPKQQTKPAVEFSKSKPQEKQKKGNKGVIYKKRR